MATYFVEILRYLQTKRPDTFVLENVSFLMFHDKGRTFAKILQLLNDIGHYNVHHALVNCSDQGLPHNRKRVFIIGIAKHIDTGTFTWPEEIECCDTSSLLDSRNQYQACTGMPNEEAKNACDNVRNCIRPLIEKGLDPLNRNYFIACDASKERTKCLVESLTLYA